MLDLTLGKLCDGTEKQKVNVKANSSQAKTTTNLKKNNSLELQGESNTLK